MSTTFEVIPVETTNISFRDVFELSEKRINSFLKSIDISSNVMLKINLHENSEKYLKDRDLDSKFEWKDNEYVWFTVDGISGGKDAYCEEIKSDLENTDPWWLLNDMLLKNKTIKDFEQKIEKAKNLNVQWCFWRSVG